MPGNDDFDSVGTAQAQGFGFTVSNGGVTAMLRVSGTHTRDIRIPDDATFTVASGSVTETIAGSAVTEVIQYTAEPTNNSLYHISSETTTLANPTTTSPNGAVHGFSLTIANNTVT